MQRIDASAIRGGLLSRNMFKAKAINSICPHCRSPATFTLGAHQESGPESSVSARANCPSCNKKVSFWVLNPKGASAVADMEIFMYPELKNYFPAQEEMTSIPEPLKRAFRSTVDSYNAGIYTAAAVSGRRTLEGIFKYLVPEEKRHLPLARLIEEANSETDLSAPLGALSHAIRSGGNLGAHFDMEHEPDEPVARQIVELLSYLISYLYVLPAKIGQLENDLNNIEARAIE